MKNFATKTVNLHTENCNSTDYSSKIKKKSHLINIVAFKISKIKARSWNMDMVLEERKMGGYTPES